MPIAQALLHALVAWHGCFDGAASVELFVRVQERPLVNGKYVNI